MDINSLYYIPHASGSGMKLCNECFTLDTFSHLAWSNASHLILLHPLQDLYNECFTLDASGSHASHFSGVAVINMEA